MAADPRPPFVVPPSFDRADWLYQCPACGRRLLFTTPDVLRQAETRMPECCGRVMDLTGLPPEDDQPAPGGPGPEGNSSG